MKSAINHTSSPHSFELSQDEVLHITASLASDILDASHVMPLEFRDRHIALFELFASKLSQSEKSRVFNAILTQGEQQ